MIKILNKYKEDKFVISKFGDYIGRPSPLGNKYTHLKIKNLAEVNVSSRDKSIKKYREWLIEELKNPLSPAKIEFNRLLKKFEERGYLFLVCFCKPLPCHGDVIAEFLEKEYPRFHPSEQLLKKSKESDFFPREFHFVIRFERTLATIAYKNQTKEQKILRLSDNNGFVPEIKEELKEIIEEYSLSSELLNNEFSSFVAKHEFSSDLGKIKVDNGLIFELNPLPEKIERKRVEIIGNTA